MCASSQGRRGREPWRKGPMGAPTHTDGDKLAALRLQVSRLETLVQELLARSTPAPAVAPRPAIDPAIGPAIAPTPAPTTSGPAQARPLDRRSLQRVAGAGAAATAAVT